MSDFSRRIANLSPEKRELLRRRMNAAQAVGVPPSMQRLGGSGPFPLSFAQQRLWFLDQLMPGSAFYNTSAHLRIATPLNAEALERAINEVIRRHEALRTTFGAMDGQPIQLIAPELTLPLVQTDLRSLLTAERENEALRRAMAHARQPFDLAQGPLLRTELLLLGPADCLFLLTMHHIVSDGWSMEIFFKELTVLYRAFAEGEPSPLGELRIQYADFARWQRRWLEDGVLRKQLSYWKQQLAGLPTLRLPTDRPRPAVQSYRGATESVVLPKELQLRLRALSEQESATLFMVLLTAFEVLISRYSGQEDFAVGTPIANRNWVEVEELIGFFVNTLVLRADLKGNPSFRELLRRVSEVAVTAYAHQHLPFEKLVEELHPARDPGRNPLFQVMFQLQTGAGPVMRAWSEASAMHSFKVERGTAQFDIAFDMWESAAGLGGQIEYSTDLFDKSTIERLIAHFEILLTGIVENPDRRISELPLLTPEEQHQLVAWNATSRPYPHSVRVQDLFEAQVSRTPRELAVISKTHSLTYGELSTASNRLAHYLQETGVSRGSIVGVCLPRSLDMTISLLAVLKAGAAYLPLDSAYPGDRIAWMLADCQASLLLSEHSAIDRLIRVNKALRVLCLTDLQEAIAAQNGSCPQVDGVENSLAYVIYTSGSTGHPKGVPVTHRALVNHNLAIAREFVLEPADRVLQFASLAFDVAAEEMFPTWLSGGTLVLHNEVALAPSDLLAELASNGVTIANLPATYWAELVAALVRSGAALPQSLRLIVIGSERVSPESVALWQRHVGAQVALFNAYGVSETTITSLLYRVPPGPPPTILRAEVPVGHPIANVRAYVLDKHQQPVPVCVPGELYLAGDGLAPGYLNEAELTQERFVRDPSGREPKLYRTGDRARFLADGNLEVLGRLDQQIKLHGFRIEPAEIESALTGHPGVREAVVSVREDAGRERRLVGHIVPDRTYCETLPADGTDGEQVSRWQTLYDEIYRQTATSDDPTFNTVGWNSTYTGLPITEDEMREWTANTVARILELRPRRVLEIGCGTGLLLFRIAPRCELYFGTDFSRVALDCVAQALTVKGCPQVRLLEREADDFRGLGSERFDTIVLNSVVQYFPSADYLLRVLAEAGQLLTPGGAIFVGDVRSLPLLPTYHTALELHRAPAELPLQKLRQRILKGMAQEQELVLDPMFFHALKGRLLGVDQVAIQVKEGRGQNELLQFRYDAVLRTSANPPEESATEDIQKARRKERVMVPVETLAWQESEFTVERLSQMLRERAPLPLRIARVPNKRVFAPATAWAWLSSGESTGTVEELRAALADLPDPSVEPDNLRQVAQALGYRVTMRWSDSSPDGYYDLELERRFGEPEGQREELSAAPRRPSDPRQSWKNSGPDGERPSNALNPRNIASGQRRAARDAHWGSYANNPTQGAYERRLAPALRNHLKEILPHYMVPAEFVLLDALPLLPNGKVNRAALPASDAARPETTRTFILPRTPTEHTLARIWEELLGLERIGIHDNFFDLGGDSILSIQIIARANQSGLRLTPQKLFQHQTIAELAEISDPAEADSRSLDWRLEDTAPKKRALPQAARPVCQEYRRFEHSS